MTTATNMSVEQIEHRLTEIANEQTAFDARDFDAELSQVIVKGGDVDALEEQHLQAERLARRLRVERQALESFLPEARINDARPKLERMEARHADLAREAGDLAGEIHAAWNALACHLESFKSLKTEAFELHRSGMKLVNDAGGESALPYASLGGFVSDRMKEVAGQMMSRSNETFALATHGFTEGYTRRTHNLD